MRATPTISGLVKEKILVIGPDGQVGHAVISLLERYGLPYVAAGLTLPDLPGAKYHLDLSDLNRLESIIREVRPTVIINPAAYTAVDKAETEKELAMTINAKAPEVLAQLSRELGALLIHYSTDYVFDGSGHEARNETATTNPINYYGFTKHQGEVALEKSGCRFVILRTSWVFSEVGHNFVKTMLRLGQEREELNIVNDQIGAPTSANELARATLLVMEKCQTHKRKEDLGIFHFCCAGEIHWHGFAEEIFRLARSRGLPLKVKKLQGISTKDYPLPAKRPLNSRLNCQKFIQTFNYHPQDWRNEVEATLEKLIQH